MENAAYFVVALPDDDAPVLPVVDELLDAPESEPDEVSEPLPLEVAPVELLMPELLVVPTELPAEDGEVAVEELVVGAVVPVAEPVAEPMPEAEPDAEPEASGPVLLQAANARTQAIGKISFFIEFS